MDASTSNVQFDAIRCDACSGHLTAEEGCHCCEGRGWVAGKPGYSSGFCACVVCFCPWKKWNPRAERKPKPVEEQTFAERLWHHAEHIERGEKQYAEAPCLVADLKRAANAIDALETRVAFLEADLT